MDFGLAKSAALRAVAAPSSAPLLLAVTADVRSPPSPISSTGAIIGTIEYMRPEQIEGKEADARSDIFSFGAMLYEMLKGELAFQGKSQVSVASAILEKDPEPICKTQPTVPAALDRVVAQCLVKDPDNRFQSAHDVGLTLKWIFLEAESPHASETTRQPLLRRALPWLVTVLLVALAAGLAVWKFAALMFQPAAMQHPVPPCKCSSLPLSAEQ